MTTHFRSALVAEDPLFISKVKKINCKEGETVGEDDVLIELE